MNEHFTNRQRADHVIRIVRAYCPIEDDLTNVGDLLSDLMHWCRLEGHCFLELVERSSRYLEEEVHEEEHDGEMGDLP